MESRHRLAILRNKNKLSETIDLINLKQYLIEGKIFTNSMIEDIYDAESELDFYEELVTRGPDAYSKFLKILTDAGYKTEREVLENTGIEDAPCYKIRSKPLGICKIINNVHFEREEERYGSDVDARSLEKLFHMLGYTVSVEPDCSGAKMRKVLRDFSKMDDWSKVDSCVVFILSHGAHKREHGDIIYGTDSDFVAKNDIYEIFNNENCKRLRGKPKIFFFCACRGDKEDEGVNTIVQPAEKVSADSVTFEVIKKPSMCDMLVVHSSLPNHKSYRDHENGTWFVQDLVEVIKNNYQVHDLETMLMTVDKKVRSRLSLKEKKQVTHIDKFGICGRIFFHARNS